MTTFAASLVKDVQVLGTLLENVLGKEGALVGEAQFVPQTGDWVYNFETTKALSQRSWRFFNELAELREYKQYKGDGSWYTDKKDLTTDWTNPKGAKWHIVVAPNQFVVVWALLRQHGVDTEGVFEPKLWDAQTIKQNTGFLVDLAFGNRFHQVDFEEFDRGEYAITVTARSKGIKEDNDEFLRILKPTAEPKVGNITQINDTEEKNDQPAWEFELLFERFSSSDALLALYRVAQAVRDVPVRSATDSKRSDAPTQTKAPAKASKKHVPVDQGAQLMAIRVTSALQALYPGEKVQVAPGDPNWVQVIFTGKANREYVSNVERIIKKVNQRAFLWAPGDKDTLMVINIGQAGQWIDALSNLPVQQQGNGSGSRGPLFVPRTNRGASMTRDLQRLSLNEPDVKANPITTTTNIVSPLGRRRTGTTRRQLFAPTDTSSTPLVSTTTAIRSDSTTDALQREGLTIVQAVAAKDVVVAALAEEVAKNTQSFLLRGPKAVSELPAGQGLGAAVISQAAIQQFYRETKQFNIPSTTNSLKDMQGKLARIKDLATGSGLMRADGEWLRFTPEMKSMRERVASQSQSLGFPIAGRLTVSVSHPPRRDVPSGIETASSMWDYALDHDTNQVAETLHAYDSKYVTGDSYDPFVATVACMVMIRGLMSKRDVTPENRAILSLAMGVPVEFNWAALDETTLLANPGILFLSTIPDLSLPTSAPEEARMFAEAFTNITQACRAIMINDLAIDKLLDDEEPDRLRLNVARTLELQWVAALFRALNDPKSRASRGFTTRVAFMWRAKVDHLTQSILAQATKAGHVKQWISELKRFQEPELSRPAQIIDAVQKWPSNSTETQLKLLLASVLVDSHYLNFSESKRQAWRQMLQDSGADIPVVRAFYYMNQFV